MAEIIFACISPHPPIILPAVGSEEERSQVSKTINSLKYLGEEIEKLTPDKIIISSPHQDWGFDVPLFFLAKDFKGEIKKILIGLGDPRDYFERGKNFQTGKGRIAIIASGDLSHCLREDGPYGFHPDGPKFDKEFIQALKSKDLEKIFQLDRLYPQAAECGLRSFCFALGILEGNNVDWHPKILSYEAPFGVGYLVARLL